jgi:hypothetical protein
VTNVTATAPFTSSGGATPNISIATQAPGSYYAGPCGYGLANASPTFRVQCPDDQPGSVVQAIDNSIQAGSVDTVGNPNFVVPGTGLNAKVLCTSINATFYIAGSIQHCNADISTIAAASLPVGPFYVMAKLDTTHQNMVSADFLATAIAPIFSYVTPTCDANASATWTNATNKGPHYWFNMGANAMFICKSAGGSFTATANGGSDQPTLYVGTCDSTGAAVDQCIADPFGMAPGRRFALFGDGNQGVLNVLSGTTTRDGLFALNSLFINNGTLSQTQSAQNNPSPGLILYSQLPVLIMNNGMIDNKGKGRANTPGSTGNGPAQNAGGLGGAGGGGGGGQTTTGGAGGNKVQWFSWSQVSNQTNGGAIGAAAGSGGINASDSLTNGAQNFPWLRDGGWALGGIGAPGGTGGGDGTSGHGRRRRCRRRSGLPESPGSRRHRQRGQLRHHAIVHSLRWQLRK